MDRSLWSSVELCRCYLKALPLFIKEVYNNNRTIFLVLTLLTLFKSIPNISLVVYRAINSYKCVVSNNLLDGDQDRKGPFWLDLTFLLVFAILA